MKGLPVLPYPYTDLATSRHRDYERRAQTHRLAVLFQRGARSSA